MSESRYAGLTFDETFLLIRTKINGLAADVDRSAFATNEGHADWVKSTCDEIKDLATLANEKGVVANRQTYRGRK